MVTIDLTEEDAKLFILFQQHYNLVAYLLGAMDKLKLQDLNMCNVQLDYNAHGLIEHSAITKHYKKLST